MPRFGRVVTAMLTPFNRDMEVDYDKAQVLADRLVNSGSDAIVVAGTTGESPTLTNKEKLELTRAVLEAVGTRAQVLMGTGNNDTAASVELTREAERLGVHGVMLVAPYYNKPPQEGLFRHFKTVADSTALPVMIYNVPGRTSSNITPETLARLVASAQNIVAVKEASGNLDQVSQIRRLTPDSFDIYSGDDSLTLPIMAVGGCGVVSVASHVAGSMIKEMVEAYAAGEVEKAWRLHVKLMPLFKVIFITTNPIPIKAAVKLAGLDCGGLRLPLVEATEAEVAEVRKVMESLELLA